MLGRVQQFDPGVGDEYVDASVRSATSAMTASTAGRSATSSCRPSGLRPTAASTASQVA